MIIVRRLWELLESLLPKAHYLPLSLDYLNKSNFVRVAYDSFLQQPTMNGYLPYV